MVKQ
jgi:hypothetical protein